MSSIDLLKKKIERERSARKMAEFILEKKSLELFESNVLLRKLNESLDEKIKERTKDLEEAKENALRAKKAEQMFLANTSHEIRTPLNAILGMCHLLNNTNLDSEQKEYLEILNSSASILKGLISDILDFSKIDKGRMEINPIGFDIYKLGYELVNIFKKSDTENTVEFVFDFDPKISKNIKADKQLLNQVLLNLLSNAKKFTKEGSVTLKMEQLQITDHFQTISFKVIDTGIGIEREDAKKIFEKYTQANNNIRAGFGGTGLGLSISQKIVSLFGGDLKVKSEIDKGSCFYFQINLKINKENETSVDQGLEPNGINETNDFKLLIAEDNVMNQKYISILLDKWGVSYTIANNGLEAVNEFKTNSYSLVLLDMQMPVMNGLEAVKEIRKLENSYSRLPIYALTASSEIDKRTEALEAGMDGYITKPFDPSQLLKIIKKYQ